MTIANTSQVQKVGDGKDPQRIRAHADEVSDILNSLLLQGYIVRTAPDGFKIVTAAGTVTSVGLSAPSSIFTVSGSPVTTSGTLALALATQNANLVFAGPTTGSAAAPTFRALVAADLPAGAGSPLTTKGDVYTFSTVNARLPVGTDGQVLTAASSQTTGLEWATPKEPLGYLPLTTGVVGPVLVDDGSGGLIGVPFLE